MKEQGSQGQFAEYASLRQEILAIKSQISTTQSVAAAATAGIFAYAGSQGEPLIFLATLLVLVPAFFKVVAHMHEIYRVGRYIQVFLEGPESGLAWETRWHDLANDPILGQTARKRTGILGPSSLLILALQATSIGVASLTLGCRGSIGWALLAACAGCAAVVGQVWHVKRMPGIWAYRQTWEYLKHQETSKTRNVEAPAEQTPAGDVLKAAPEE